MTVLILDIETIGTRKQEVRDYIANTIKPPATIKLPASIEKWHKESKAEAVEEAIAKTGLDGAFGQVVCVGYMFEFECSASAIYGLDEPVLLTELNALMDTIPRSEWFTTQIVGHNVHAFDLRFLLQRYIVNGIKPHIVLLRAMTAKPWATESCFDTMTQFAGATNRISLDKLCMALGVPSPKGDMDGSMVSQAVADGRLGDVVDYCKKDVEATYACYKRMTWN